MNHKKTHVLCHMCGREFGSQQLLKAHIRECHYNLELQCTICGMQFNTSMLLGIHSLVCQQKSRKIKVEHVCGLCDKSFSRLDSMIRHQQRVHAEFHCDSCDETFKDLKSLRRHEQDMHSQNMCGRQIVFATG